LASLLPGLASLALVPATPADDGTLKDALERWHLAREARQPWESVYDDCYLYGLPSKTSFYDRNPGVDRTSRIFDETAVVAVQELASRLQAGIVPSNARWAELEPGGDVPAEERAEVLAALEGVNQFLFDTIQSSNFAQEIHEALLDLALGTACLRVDEGDAQNPLVFSAIPLPQLYLDTGPDDRVDTIFRERHLRADRLEVAYPGAVVPEEIVRRQAHERPRQVVVVEGCYRLYDRPNAERWRYVVLVPEHKALLLERELSGQGSCPYVPFRWAKAAGEVWGRGPLLNVMPAVRTCNLTVQLILENADMAVAGIWTAEDDGILNADNVRLIPGTIVPVSPGSGGLKPLAPAGSFDVAQLVLQDMRDNIKRGLYNDQLGRPDKTPMSATEVSERQADLARAIGAAFGRLFIELATGVVQRSVHILKRRGLVQLPLINGRQVKLRATSPLAQAQAFQDITALDRLLEMFAVRFGPQAAMAFTKPEAIAPYLAERFNVPLRLVRSEQELKRMAQQAGQMMQQQQEQGAGAGAAAAAALPPAGA
jgi:hypothetical protein